MIMFFDSQNSNENTKLLAKNIIENVIEIEEKPLTKTVLEDTDLLKPPKL
jgi:hypothetical protein